MLLFVGSVTSNLPILFTSNTIALASTVTTFLGAIGSHISNSILVETLSVVAVILIVVTKSKATSDIVS